MAGAWEFPGGKLEAGETRLAGLARELHEELGIQVLSARPLIRYKHVYPGLEVDLDVWCVQDWEGDIQSREGQDLRWCSPKELRTIGLLPADAPILDALRLPDRILVTPARACGGEKAFLDDLERAGQAATMICLRRPDLDATALLNLASGAACRLAGTGARLLLHGDPSKILALLGRQPGALDLRLESAIAGVHMPSQSLEEETGPLPQTSLLLGASCHDAAELMAAARLGASYAFLGNIRETPSHPGQPGMGWQRFEELVRDLPLPVYAIGGLGPEDLETAWAHGAQGIAAIRSLWPKD
jgi:8-oxo-dGTP diphosphatase